MANFKTKWQPENDKILTELHAAGVSFSRIAQHIPGRSRNSCISRASRLGLVSPSKVPVRYENHEVKTNSYVAAAPRKPSMPKIKALQKPIVEPGKEFRITISNLSDKTCKWPIGDPKKKDFCFCGGQPREASDGGGPYCDYHAKIAYVGTVYHVTQKSTGTMRMAHMGGRGK